MKPLEWLDRLLDWLEGGAEPPEFKGEVIKPAPPQAKDLWRSLCAVLTHRRRDEGVLMMAERDFLASLMPELLRLKEIPQPKKFHPEGDAFCHSILTLRYLTNPTCPEAVAALLHDVGKSLTFTLRDRIRFNQHNTFGTHIVESVARRLHMPKNIKELSLFVCKNHMLLLDIENMRLPRLARLVNSPHFESMLKIWKADINASHGDDESLIYAKRVKKVLTEKTIPKRWHHPLSVSEAKKAGLTHEEAVRAVREIDLLALQGVIRTKKEALDHLRSQILRHKNNHEKDC